jgi:RsmE family RNA methyltransferase
MPMTTTYGPARTVMNLLLFTERDRVAPDKIALYDHRLEHLRQVHRATVGDSLRIGEVDGLVGEGKILELNDQQVIMSTALEQSPPEKLPLTVVLALPRPKMLRRILRAIAEMGVAELHLINSYRVEKSYWQSPVLGENAVRTYLLQGLEQARDTRLPLVRCHQRFKPFVEDILPAMTADKQVLLAQPGDYPACPRDIEGPALLVVGPEGGFIPYEVEKLQGAGCTAVSLGPRILRVEHAITVLLGRLF